MMKQPISLLFAFIIACFSTSVAQQLKPGFDKAEYTNSNHYVRTVTTIVLYPNAAYYQIYKNDPAKIFGHHLHNCYLYLLENLND